VLQIDSLSDEKILLEWLFLQENTFDIYSNKEEFAIKVLSNPVSLSQAGARAMGMPGNSSVSGEQYVFMGRIMGEGAPSPHEQFLPDPCDLATTEEPAYITRLISMHTKFLISNKQPPPFTVGSIVYGRLGCSSGEDGGTYNLQYAELDRLSYKTSAYYEQQKTLDCPEVKGINDLFLSGEPFALQEVSRVGAGADAAVVNINISPSDWLPCIEDIRPLLDFIASGEGGYNSMNQGTSNNQIVGSTHDASTIIGSNLTEMTISQVQAYQAKPSGDPKRLFAAGRYQIIPATMPSAIANSGLTNDLVFNEENQDILGAALIFGKRPIMGNYILGLHDNQHEAHLAFAQEWASVPDPTKEPPQSYYGHGNKSAHTNEQVAAALDAARAAVSTKCGASLSAAGTDSSYG
tara:strand:- start:394 stop:1611 length:1218 start_codon:yes stop_codon:yes gene_type:complete